MTPWQMTKRRAASASARPGAGQPQERRPPRRMRRWPMTEIVPVVTGQVVPAGPPISVREVRAEFWDEPEPVRGGRLLAAAFHRRTPGPRTPGHRRMVRLLRRPRRTGQRRAPRRRGRVERRAPPPGARPPPSSASSPRCPASTATGWTRASWTATLRRTRRPRALEGADQHHPDRKQAAQLLGYVDGLADPRPTVIVRLLAETGMRVSELLGARVEDLAMNGGHYILRVTRKGGSSRRCRSPRRPGTGSQVTWPGGPRGGSSGRRPRRESASGGQLARWYI